jgi:hypothetical protein
MNWFQFFGINISLRRYNKETGIDLGAGGRVW